MTLDQLETLWEENGDSTIALYRSLPLRTALKLAEEALACEKFALASALFGQVTTKVTALWFHANTKYLEQMKPE